MVTIRRGVWGADERAWYFSGRTVSRLSTIPVTFRRCQQPHVHQSLDLLARTDGSQTHFDQICQTHLGDTWETPQVQGTSRKPEAPDAPADPQSRPQVPRHRKVGLDTRPNDTWAPIIIAIPHANKASLTSSFVIGRFCFRTLSSHGQGRAQRASAG